MMKKMRMRTVLVLVSCWVALAVIAESAVVKETDAASGQERDAETIAEFEKRLKKLVNSGVKMVLPYMMEMIAEIKLNQTCLQGLFMLLSGVKDIKDWAVRMVDAMGKPSAGILEGTPIAIGDYDECLDVAAPRKMRPVPVPPYTEEQIAFRGQYCVVQLNIPENIRQAAMDYQVGNRTTSELANTQTFLRSLVKLAPLANTAHFRVGVCIPSLCSEDDLDILMNELASSVKLSTSVLRCETKQKTEYRTEHTVILSAIGLLAMVVFIGTMTDIVYRFKNPNLDVDIVLENKGCWVQCVAAFSFSRNAHKLFSLNHTDCPKISSIRGMKFLTVCLYILVWLYATPLKFHFLKFRNAFNIYEFMKDGWFSILSNASVGADSLILLAGLQISYRFWWKNVDRNAICIPKLILKWYTRFTLSQGMVICIVLCLPLLANGPMWADVVSPTIENCQQRWWMNVLAVNNFSPTEDTCLPHTWLICCLFHMLIVGAILLFILEKSVSCGIFVSIALILGSSIAIAMVTLMNDLPPAPSYYFMSFVNVTFIWENMFIQAYDHIAPFCIGILLGYFLSHYHDVKLKKTTVTIGWCATIVLNLSILCGLYGYHNGDFMERNLAAFYASVHRTGWSLGIAWIVIACAYGYGGCANRILSWKVFIIYDRLANLVFLLHPVVLLLYEGQLRTNLFMGHLEQVMYATACIVFTLILASLSYITCIAPFLYFEKKFWYYEAPSKSSIANISETPKRNSKHRSNSIIQEKFKFEAQPYSSTDKPRIAPIFNT